VDQSGAFDRARRNRLYRQMIDKNVPYRHIQWSRAFLTDRTACVRVNGVRSAKVTMEQGYPQGTVNGSAYWGIYSDGMPRALRGPLPYNQCEIALFADDCGILLMAPTQSKLRAAAQGVLQRLEAWEIEHDAVVSTKEGSTEYIVLHGSRAAGSSWDPKLTFKGQPLRRAKDGVIKYLGVHVDGALNFATHAAYVRGKLDKRQKVLKSFASQGTRCSYKTVRAVYNCYLQPCLDYGIAAWGPRLTESAKRSLNSAVYNAGRAISGCTYGTRTGVVLREARIRSVHQCIDRSTVLMYERLRRLPRSNRARQVMERDRPLEDRCGRSRARQCSAKAGLDQVECEPIVIAPTEPPWRHEGGDRVRFRPDLCKKVRKNDVTPAELRSLVGQTLAGLQTPTVTAYTDGSVLRPEQFADAGGAYVMRDAEAEESSNQCPAGIYATSFRAETCALRLALRDLAKMPPRKICADGRSHILLCTDSRSAVQALSRGPSAQTGMLECDTWNALAAVLAAHPTCTIDIQWVPGHSAVAQNTAADAAAGRAAAHYRDNPDAMAGGVGVPLELAKAVLGAYERSCDDTSDGPDGVPNGHAWRRATEGTVPPLVHRATRREQRLLCQLRAGKCPLTRDYVHKIAPDRFAAGALCPSCKKAPDCIEHFFGCPALAEARQSTLGCDKVPLTVLRDKQYEVLRYVHATGRWRTRRPATPAATNTSTGPTTAAAAAAAAAGPADAKDSDATPGDQAPSSRHCAN
jgi:ribonuclease HI